MVEGRGGVILNMGWDGSNRGMAGPSGELFATTKGAVMAFTRSLAQSLAPKVRVNCLAPGWFRTEQNKVLYEDQEWVDYLVDRIPMKRPGQPHDLDGAVVFLASEASRYVTGQTLLVDGGISTGAMRATVAKK